MTRKKVSYQLELKKALHDALERLGATVSDSELSEASSLIVDSMSRHQRFYHSPEHIFQVAKGLDDISMIAAAFHDVVYFQLDSGVGINVARRISRFIVEKSERIFISQEPEILTDPVFRVISGVFGVHPGQELSIELGQNEFMSALLAGTVLEKHLNPVQIAQTAASIEATIPFRGLTARGRTPAQLLLSRLETLSREMGWSLGRDELRSYVKRAVRFANRDLQNFAEKSPDRFLDHTWDLLPEVNPSVREGALLSIRGYRVALQKMELFFRELYPEIVFQRFEGEPEDDDFAALLSCAEQNIQVAQPYFRIRLIALGILECLSESLGENVSLSSLMGEEAALGDIRDLGGDRLDDFLPKAKIKTKGNSGGLEGSLEHLVRETLLKGREKAGQMVIRKARFTEFLIDSLGFDSTLDLWEPTERYFQGDLGQIDYLRQVPRSILDMTSNAFTALMERRSSRIRDLIGDLGKTPEKQVSRLR